MTVPPLIDLVIPVYNEGDNILRVLEALGRSVHVPMRILVCYDEEGDSTLVALQRYRPGGQTILEPVRNRYVGVHGAVRTGFEESRAPAVAVMPADDDYNTGLIERMYHRISEGGDVICPSRFMKGGRMVGCRWQKAVLVRLAAFLLYHLGRLPTHDPTNGFRMFSRRVIDSIQIESTEGFTYSIELLAKAHRLRWPIEEIPALWFERKQGDSRFRIRRWMGAYLRWFFYAFGTTFLGFPPSRVRLREAMARTDRV